MPVIAYFINRNTLDSQSSGRGRGGPTFLNVGGIFHKTITEPCLIICAAIRDPTLCSPMLLALVVAPLLWSIRNLMKGPLSE